MAERRDKRERDGHLLTKASALNDAITQLGDERDAALLKAAEGGWSLREIAAALAISTSSVHRAIDRAEVLRAESADAA